MTAPAKKTAPAPAKRAPVKRGPVVAAMDYSGLTATDVDAATVTGKRNSMLDKTPFVAWVRDSRQNGTGKTFSVPAEAAEQTERLLRLAARQVGCGLRIVPGTAQNGQVTIAFKAKDKKRTTAK